MGLKPSLTSENHARFEKCRDVKRGGEGFQKRFAQFFPSAAHPHITRRVIIAVIGKR
jgi:hypothetical protein